MKKFFTRYDLFCEEFSSLAVFSFIALFILFIALVKWGVTLAAILKFFSL